MTSTSDFTHTGLPMRVLFGAGRRHELPTEVERLKLSRVMIVCTPPQRDAGLTIAAALGELAHSVYPFAVMHVPREVADAAVEYAETNAVDGVIAVGGGSAVGLAKAIALRTSLPSIAVPTTYAGSEMTPIWGLTEGNEKTTGRDWRVLPRTVIYDPELTVTLPPTLSATSGVNAMAHAAEALYAPDASPIITMMAVESVRALNRALPAIVADPVSVVARAEALYGAWLAGSCLGATTMSLHHKLCHILGGTFDLAHAEVHTTVLPYVLAYNLDAAPVARALLAEALGGEDPATELYGLEQQVGVAASLRDLGMPESGIDTVVEMATANPYANPRAVTADGVRALVSAAFFGRHPAETLSVR
ncbi:maleylacetate reductase [Mycobacterium kyogaense]|uniref:maleylacetate reductase n=1 Tax=Mycobacterium kyogaense TaxID=2212479 RepID=UPI000DAD9AEF|nr:maleylacetate reductase [Mycobacterium kyogaense]